MQLLSAEQRLQLEAATTRYASDLAQDAEAQAYLQSRGFTPRAAVQARYGVVRRPMVGHEAYSGRLALPYRTPVGVVNMRFRCLKQHACKDEGCPKYLGLAGLETNLYGVLDLQKPSPFICVTEGEIDRDTLSLLCDIPAVAVPGATNWHKHFSRCLDDFSKVFVLGDGDTAGSGLNKKLINDVRAIPVRMPKGEDCNSLYLKEGPDGLRRLIA